LVKTDDVQNVSLGVLGKALVSIEGLDVVQSAMEASSIRDGSRQPATPSRVKQAQYCLASFQVNVRESTLRCQMRPVTSSVTWLPPSLTV
jgi:hypothetical protein